MSADNQKDAVQATNDVATDRFETPVSNWPAPKHHGVPELWAVHAQGPDDIYPAYDRADAERHAAELNAIPTPPGISVAAVVIPSPMAPLEHWKGVAEQEREHKLHLLAGIAPTDANLSAMRREGLSIDGDNAYKRDVLDCVVGALASGKQRGAPPPAEHWLHRFWEIGQAEADERDALRELPPLGESLRSILGRPNFACAGIANRLRAMGHAIPRKSEEEQAATIHWLLGLFLKHGEDWATHANAALAATQEQQP